MATLAFAAGGAFLDIISLIPEGIGLVRMFDNLISPPFEGTQDTIVRVQLGSQADKEDTVNLGGDIPGIALWDMNGSLIGKKDGRNKKLRQGAFEDIKITAREEVGNVQAHYLSVSSGGIDAICVAAVTVTFPDGAKTGFTGNIAEACGAPWANSETPIAQAVAGGPQPTSDCVWIDGNGSNDLIFQGFGVHLPSFGLANKNLATSYKDDMKLMCKSGPRFRMYDKLTANDPILIFPTPPKFLLQGDEGVDESNMGKDADPGFVIENPGIDAERPDKKKRSTRSAPHETTEGALSGFTHLRSSRSMARAHTQSLWGQRGLGAATNTTSGVPISSTRNNSTIYHKVIVSPHNYNSAKRLCESETSWGQSFVSLMEGLFCDMEDKTLYFTCDNKEAPSPSSCCYDTEQDNLLACSTTLSRRNGATQLHKPISSLMFDIGSGAITQGMMEGKNFTNVKHW